MAILELGSKEQPDNIAEPICRKWYANQYLVWL